jgi:hypothetical protein
MPSFVGPSTRALASHSGPSPRVRLPLMSSSPTSIVAYLTLFAVVGFATIFVALLLGWFLRASNRTPEKLEVYECGEPPVGSGIRSVRPPLLRRGSAVHYFRCGSGVLLPVGNSFRQSNPIADPDLATAAATAELDPVQQKLSELGVPDPQKLDCIGRWPNGRSPGPCRDDRHRRLLRRVDGRLRLCMAARRFGLGSRSSASPLRTGPTREIE